MGSVSKERRSSVACNLCRESRVKCINKNDGSVCQRCIRLEAPCAYTLRKSQLKSRLIAKNFNNVKSNSSSNSGEIPLVNQKIDTSYKNYSVIFPPRSMILEVVDIFFENQYNGIFPFTHRPSLTAFLESEEFEPDTYINDYFGKYFKAEYENSLKYPDPILLLAILALCSRLHNLISRAYGSFSERESPEAFKPVFENAELEEPNSQTKLISSSNASNYFGWHARNLLKEVFDSPTIQRIQSLTLLSSHEWGEGNNARSYLYIGLASRMALVLGLGNEESLHKINDKQSLTALDYISIESKRRTVWSVYMMDKCNSSGRDRATAIRIEDIKIKFPCEEKDFIFGNCGSAMTYENAFNSIYSKSKNKRDEISIYGYKIILFQIWSKIAKWVCEIGGKRDQLRPWDSKSNFATLSCELNTFQDSLNADMILNDFNLEAHISQLSAASFGYLHSLLLMCRIFLNREYFYCDPESFPCGWWKSCSLVLLNSVDLLTNLIRTLKLKNAIVIAPFTGFEIFTAAATSLYFFAFPNEILRSNFPLPRANMELTINDEVIHIKQKYKMLVDENIEFLKTWSDVWSLGKRWLKLIENLRYNLSNLVKNESLSLENDTLKDSIQDYGTGKVQEVYNPSYIDKRKSNLKMESSLDKDSYMLDSNEFNDVGSLSTVAEVSHKSFKDDEILKFFNSPIFNYINTNYTVGLLPDWNGFLEI